MSAEVLPGFTVSILDNLSNGDVARFALGVSGLQTFLGLVTGVAVPIYVMNSVMTDMKKAEEKKEVVRLKEREEDRAERMRREDRITLGVILLAAIFFAIYFKT